ncbi:uncharacterized protein [Branchiostoma lanceolatum]|uniref:uncharacterized protein isoform X2 n=1 Tax=Branchiostoma lanceolatum TaxID=7740 RepID=UPI0034526521
MSKEDHYEPFRLGNLESTILERHDHQDCPSRTLKIFKVFNSAGRVCYWRIFVCEHEADACTLLRFGLWAATADRPQTAFSTELLEWLTALTLECQVSVKGFCNAVRWMSGLCKYEVDILYRALIGQSVAEFHHHLYKRRTLLHLCSHLGDGTVCPACSKGDGEMIVSLDANFGLVRKKSSGTSSAGPLHQSTYFLPDDQVTKFMSDYSQDSKPDEDCNNFQAGSSVRSRSRQEKLDVTGVFGAVCRHSMPVKFLDMHHGERLGYPVHLIEELLSAVQPGRNLKLHVMYDIACVLTAHLEHAERWDLLEAIELAIPIFHCYGHKSSCQILYSPRRKEGFGLTDGECVERLWSYLRGFNSITKEMTPTHRTDLLTDALLHYGRRKVADMHVSLVQNYDKAEKTYKLASDELKNIMEQAPVAVSEDDVETWRKNEIDLIKQWKRGRQRSSLSQWKKTYALDLSVFFSIRDEMQSCTDGILRSALMAQYKEMEQKLVLTERKHKISRWKEDHDDYKTTLLLVDSEERRSLLEKLWREASERTFLLSLKKKYPDGQAIAKKLGRLLKSINKKLKKTIANYNKIARLPLDTSFPRTIDFQEACQPTWQCYTQLDLLEDGLVPKSVQRQAIDALCLKKCAEEELRMTSKDMINFIESGLAEYETISESIKMYKNDGDIGAVAMLHKKRDALQSQLHFAHTMFGTKLEILPEVPTGDSANLSSDLEYSLDSEYDEEEDDDESEGEDDE